MGNDVQRINCVRDNCGTFPMDSALVTKLKRTGETFTCPAGHEQHFTDSPEQELKQEIQNLKRRVESLRRDSEEWFDRWSEEKERRRLLERIVLERVVGVVEVGPYECKWACSCGSRGQKAFDDPEACRDAWSTHRQRDGCGESIPQDVIEA